MTRAAASLTPKVGAAYVARLEALALGADKLPPMPIHPININRGDDDQ